MKPWISVFLLISVQTAYIDDSIFHDITYHSIAEAPDPEELLKHLDLPSDNYLAIRSGKDERYVCQLPETTDVNIAPTAIYSGPSPAELLAPLSNDKLCSYRQDTYWFYELCHGRFLVQFHEDKNTKKRTEFYLGNFKQDYVSVGMSKIEQMNPPKKMVEGEERAYFNVSYVQGTHCDLINGPRTANVLYVCSEEYKHHFLSYTEISTCKYEVIIMTSRLCSHPAYRLKPKKNKHIHCYNVDEEAPAKPSAVAEMEKSHEVNFKNEYVIKILSDVDPKILQEAVRDLMKENDLFHEAEAEIPMRLVGKPRQGWTLSSPFPNEQILKETVDLILTGQECITADQGWWIFEICYGKTIKQMHYEGPNRVVEHLLGRFDGEIHKAWVDQSPENREPKEYDDKILQVSHLYSMGDVCHENKAHRSAEVRLRCKQGQQMLGTVTLTIEEPGLCQYIITVESDRFCEPIQYADEYGIIRVEPVDIGPSVTTDPPPSDAPKEDLKL